MFNCNKSHRHSHNFLLSPANDEYGHNEHNEQISLYKIIDSNVRKFGYIEKFSSYPFTRKWDKRNIHLYLTRALFVFRM